MQKITELNKGNALALFINCINMCYYLEDCSKCIAYNPEYETCEHSNPISIEVKENTCNRILNIYCIEHLKHSCRKCEIITPKSIDSMCMYNQMKILWKLKH